MQSDALDGGEIRMADGSVLGGRQATLYGMAYLFALLVGAALVYGIGALIGVIGK